MLKKLKISRGYLLLESLLSLSILCVIIFNYQLLTTFLLKKAKESQQQVEMHRILYEEVRLNITEKKEASKQIIRGNRIYTVHFFYKDEQIMEVKIYYEKNYICIKKDELTSS